VGGGCVAVGGLAQASSQCCRPSQTTRQNSAALDRLRTKHGNVAEPRLSYLDRSSWIRTWIPAGSNLAVPNWYRMEDLLHDRRATDGEGRDLLRRRRNAVEIEPPAFWKNVAFAAFLHVLALGVFVHWNRARTDDPTPRVVWLTTATARPGHSTQFHIHSEPSRRIQADPGPPGSRQRSAREDGAYPAPISFGGPSDPPTHTTMGSSAEATSDSMGQTAFGGTGLDSSESTASATADYRSNPAPDYPLASRLLGEEGRVLVRVLVDSAGQPDRVQLARPCGFSRLDNSAVAAVKAWKFLPARRRDRAVAAWVTVPVRFSLKKG